MSTSPIADPPVVPSGVIFRPPQTDLNGVEKPTENDVLCGRGVTTNRHRGNEKFRSLVNLNKELYVTSTKRQKMGISKSIVEAVRGLDPQGRFLEKDVDSALWFDIGDKKAVEKTSQALRDGAASLRKQLSRDLGDPDFLSAVFDGESNKAGPKKKDLKKVKEKKPAKRKQQVKGHRRTKSNPVMTTAARKAMLSNARSTADPVPSRGSVSLHVPAGHFSPRSPVSPRSELSAPAYLRSPGSLPRTQHMFEYSPRHFEHSSDAVRSASFRQQRPPPMSPQSFPTAAHTPPPREFFGSPTCSSGPHHSPHRALLNPRTYPGGPTALSPGRHTMSPAGYHHHTSAPHGAFSWSPRRTHPGHPYDHPPYMSPPCGYPLEYRPGVPPPGRGPYSRPSADITLPRLGHERYPRPLPPPFWHRQDFAPPPSPPSHHRRSQYSMSGQQAMVPDKKSRLQAGGSGRRSRSPLAMTMTSSEMGVEVKLDMPEILEVKLDMTDSRGPSPLPPETPPRSIKIEDFVTSPSAVPDIGFSEDAIISEAELMVMPPSLLRTTLDEKDDHPFDEPDPASEDISMSPLPLNQNEEYCVDPCSLMTLPENIMNLPISPCGPYDTM